MPQELDLPTPGGILYSITRHTTRFYGYCCENKVWLWMLITCLTHEESNPQPWSSIHRLSASTGTRFNRLRDFRMVYPMISRPTFFTSCTVQRDQDLSECLPCTSRARADCTVLYNRIWYFLRFLKSDRFFPNRYIIMG